MEEYSEGHSSITVADDDRHLRFNRGSDAGGLSGEDQVTDGTREAADEYGAVSGGTKKRRMAVKKESSYKEAPSSLERAGSETDGAWNEELKNDGAASGTRLKNSRYAAALRKERGSDTGRISGDGRRMAEGSDDARLIGTDDKGIEGEAPEGNRNRLRQKSSVFHKTAGTEKAGCFTRNLYRRKPVFPKKSLPKIWYRSSRSGCSGSGAIRRERQDRPPGLQRKSGMPEQRNRCMTMQPVRGKRSRA